MADPDDTLSLSAPKRRAPLGLVLVALAVLVGLLAVAFGVTYTRIDDSMRTRDEELLSSLVEAGDDTPFYLLLLGVDKGEERFEDENYGTDPGAYRADTIMLCRIDPVRVSATIVSIHRDIRVELPGGGTGKINSVYSLAGPAGMVDAVSKLTGVHINHYAEIDFDGLMRVVDVVGGVEVTLPVDVVDPGYTELNLKAGTHVLNAHDALMLCRARHAYDAYGDGDRYRAANQRMVIAAIVRRVLSSDVATMVSAVTAMAESVTTDIGLDEILGLASQMRGLDTEHNLMSGMIPTTPEVVGGVYYEAVEWEAWAEMMRRVDLGLSPVEGVDETQGVAGSIEGHAATDAAAAGGFNLVGDGSSIVVLGGGSGRAQAIADILNGAGYLAGADEHESYVRERDVIVYANPSLAAAAQTLADYLGGGFTVMANDGTYQISTDFLICLTD